MRRDSLKAPLVRIPRKTRNLIKKRLRVRKSTKGKNYRKPISSLVFKQIRKLEKSNFPKKITDSLKKEAYRAILTAEKLNHGFDFDQKLDKSVLVVVSN